MYVFIACLIGYLLGSIPFALVIGKLFYHTDIRNSGSGNLGGSNAGRVLGKKAGVSVTVLDAIKCCIAMALMYFINPEYMMFAGFSCAVGHCYPLFAKFKGGKAVATIMGYLLGLAIFQILPWYCFIAPVASFFIILKLTKYVSLSSICAEFIAVILSLFTANITITSSILLLFLFSTYRHKSNIQRLIAKTETKVTWI